MRTPPEVFGIVASFRASWRAGGKIVLTRKFIEGMQAYIELWPGPVTAFLEPDTKESDDLDKVAMSPDDLPFALVVGRFDSPKMADLLAGCAVVSASVSDRTNHVALLCAKLGVPLVYVSELSLPTRLQILDATPTNPLVRARRYVWAVQQEWRQIAAIQSSSGIQCNGTPTFDAYERLTPRPLLFFDTRIHTDEQIDHPALAARIARAPRHLRLVFSGRLDRIKGANHLVPVAAALRRDGVPFDLDIYGSGPLEVDILRDIERLALADRVHLHGAVDFHRELLPSLKRTADLFICGHRQGDPSCTYLETLGCGVPIIGYDNEALVGILQYANVGATVATDDIEALAAKIADIGRHRDRVDFWSHNAVDFARQHAFETTMSRRVEHLARIGHDRRANHVEQPYGRTINDRMRSLALAAETSLRHRSAKRRDS